MHTQLLNIGFVKQPDGTYLNSELSLRVTIKDATHVYVSTPTGIVTATIDELEEAIITGGFGAF